MGGGTNTTIKGKKSIQGTLLLPERIAVQMAGALFELPFILDVRCARLTFELHGVYATSHRLDYTSQIYEINFVAKPIAEVHTIPDPFKTVGEAMGDIMGKDTVETLKEPGVVSHKLVTTDNIKVYCDGTLVGQVQEFTLRFESDKLLPTVELSYTHRHEVKSLAAGITSDEVTVYENTAPEREWVLERVEGTNFYLRGKQND